MFNEVKSAEEVNAEKIIFEKIPVVNEKYYSYFHISGNEVCKRGKFSMSAIA